VFRDVTEEEEISQMKSDFIAIASHELRTPLTSVKGFINLLLDEAGGPISIEQRELLNVAKQNADRLNHLVSDLLDLSHIESGKMQLQRDQINIVPIVTKLAEELEQLFTKKGLTLVVEMPASLPFVFADPRHVKQIITNLLTNAAKYTKQGYVTIYANTIDSYLQVHVQDTGFGISSTDQEKLFRRFTRSHAEMVRMEQGTGLGLHITQALVLLQKGDLSVESTLGKGSIFTFTLPLVTPMAEQLKKAETLSKNVRTRH
jgi:signal transduction histidine kinase